MTATIERPENAADLGAAYGELGKLLMAATYFDAAEVCYLNAQTLAPIDMRWPYYLGHLDKAKARWRSRSRPSRKRFNCNQTMSPRWSGSATSISQRGGPMPPSR
ncbi:MAG: hypothetical protein DMF98_08100, partial [Acidobacteria bacterium]